MVRRSSLRKTSSKTKTELGKYSGKYALNELLVCGECGSPYRRRLWMPTGEKRYVWRCLNRLEHGKRLCRESPTLEESELHAAIIAAMNEMFRMQEVKQALRDSITAALAGGEDELSLPAVESQIQRLQERQMELFQLAVAAGADCIDYDEELMQVNMAKTSLTVKKAELERQGRTAANFDRRMEEVGSAIDDASAALTAFDDITVRQLISNIKVMDKDHLLIRFKDGTEIEQQIESKI